MRRSPRVFAQRLLATRRETQHVQTVSILRTDGAKEASGNRAIFSSRRNGPLVVESRLIPDRPNSFETFWHEATHPTISEQGSRVKVVGILKKDGAKEASGNRVLFGSRRNQSISVESRLIPGRLNAFETFWYEAALPTASILRSKLRKGGRFGNDMSRTRRSKISFKRGDGAGSVNFIPENDSMWFFGLGSMRWFEDGRERRRSYRLMAQQKEK